MTPSPIAFLGLWQGNALYIKREDLLPFSFGGNKARKAELFFRMIDEGNYDCLVTYGTGSSNHCRVMANGCCRRGMGCYIISPEEEYEESYNSWMTKLFGAEITVVPADRVHDTIEERLEALRKQGRNPLFVEGGGHGNTGTQAYVDCYQEVLRWEEENKTFFDYIFLASGTGTTQAGLVCGQLLQGDKRSIVGISIARKNPRGREVVLDSIRAYLGERTSEAQIQQTTIFRDEYTSGYGKKDDRVDEMISFFLKHYGICLDPVYTGKAMMGMDEYIRTNAIQEKNILFIHTGGTPLFFDYLRKQRKES